MDLTEAADAIREKLIDHRISGRANLWSTIVKQIRKQNSFDGRYADINDRTTSQLPLIQIPASLFPHPWWHSVQRHSGSSPVIQQPPKVISPALSRRSSSSSNIGSP